MTGEIGQLALCLALALSLAQAAAGFAGAALGSERVMAMCRGAALGVFVFLALAFFSLMFAYVTSDFSVLAVAQNSHTTKPLLYKIAGVWGNHEGSMLLWLLILGVYSAAMAVTEAGGERLNARALGVQALVAIAFLIFVLFTSDPFLRVYPPPFEGDGLNPLLQDPGLSFHPPILYTGYVGLSATFSFAVAALLEARNDAAWVRAARPFALASWIALTLGIAGGSWWAYYTLGWGGFWSWDPVENASFMPWLVCTALFHSMMATEKSGAFKSWTLLLAMAAFSFSLIGTFLVRSGVLNSVHSFANDPQRGLFILVILAISIASPLVLFAWRAPKLLGGAPFEAVSRETGILINNLLLTVTAAAVLIGVVTPLLLDAAEDVKITVGAPYYNIVVILLLALLAICVPFGPLLNWRRASLASAAYTLRYAFAAAALAVLLALTVAAPSTARGVLGVAFSAWLIVGAACDIGRRARNWRGLRTLTMGVWAVALAHGGLGVVALGITGATAWKSEAIQVLQQGQTMNIAGYALRLGATDMRQGPNYTAKRAAIDVSSSGRAIATLYPENREYPVEGVPTTHSAIRTTGLSDLYVVLGDQLANGAWVVRAYVNPLAPLIWLGAMIMALGGFLTLAMRLGQARSARVPAAAAAGIAS